MKIKLTLYPTELNTESLAERLIGVKSESERAQVIKNLLVVQASGVTSLPSWLMEMPKHPFQSLTRGQTTRISFSRSDPALKQLMTELDPLDHAQRSAQLKSMLKSLDASVISTAPNPTTPTTTQSAPPNQMTGADFSPEPDNTQEISDKSRKFRSGAAGFKI